MISLDDPKWKQLLGGRRIPFDAAPALDRLQRGVHPDATWEELWNGLHHQGNIGEASYAAVPFLTALRRSGHSLGWNFYALLSTIEIERHHVSNPSLPAWLQEEYQSAWRDIFEFAVEDISKASDSVTVRSILGAMAIAKGNLKLGCLIVELDDSELTEILEQKVLWSQQYREV